MLVSNTIKIPAPMDCQLVSNLVKSFSISQEFFLNIKCQGIQKVLLPWFTILQKQTLAAYKLSAPFDNDNSISKNIKKKKHNSMSSSNIYSDFGNDNRTMAMSVTMTVTVTVTATVTMKIAMLMTMTKTMTMTMNMIMTMTVTVTVSVFYQNSDVL